MAKAKSVREARMNTFNLVHNEPSVKFKPETEICSFCREEYPKGDYGSATEHGRNRRFCNPCFSDFLRVNGVRPNDFLDD